MSFLLDSTFSCSSCSSDSTVVSEMDTSTCDESLGSLRGLLYTTDEMDSETSVDIDNRFNLLSDTFTARTSTPIVPDIVSPDNSVDRGHVVSLLGDEMGGEDTTMENDGDGNGTTEIFAGMVTNNFDDSTEEIRHISESTRCCLKINKLLYKILDLTNKIANDPYSDHDEDHRVVKILEKELDIMDAYWKNIVLNKPIDLSCKRS